MIKNKQGAAFDTFDPSLGNHFDPSVGNKNNATGDSTPASTVTSAKVGQKMQFNITLNNPSAVPLTFELFNYLNSYTRILNSTYVQGTYKYIPLYTFEGILALTAAANHGGVVGFDQAGNLEIRGDTAAAELSGTIGCSEIGYSGLFEASGITPFAVSFIRFTSQTSPQINQPLIWFRKTYSGGEEINNVSPKAYFKPTQFQNFIIDITVSMDFGIDKGLRTKVLAGETVELSFFVYMWVDQVLGS